MTHMHDDQLATHMAAIGSIEALFGVGAGPSCITAQMSHISAVIRGCGEVLGGLHVVVGKCWVGDSRRWGSGKWVARGGGKVLGG